jgi:2-keto-4-pentenoate hydratase/2-oxohepta-3-ene-1,7-dioic acid hydratase in catechol pathway
MKIFCIGRNYVAHAKELNNDIPSSPLVFMKPPTALLKGNKAFYYPEFSNNIHYEGELIVKIAKNGKHISPKFARDYYKDISVGMDLTARDLQASLKEKGHPWEIAKGFDGSAVVGQFYPLEDSVENLKFTILKNGREVQIGKCKDMIFHIDHLIAHLSKYFMLQTGDLIYTGTPEGVGEIAIGDVFEGFLGEKRCFRTEIK